MSRDFQYPRRVQFAETDMAGVLHFANYFRYMEETEHALWRSMGCSVYMEDAGSQSLSWPRVSVSCDYSAPARFEDELDLRLKITKIGARSISYEVEFLRGTARIALGQATVVCCMTDHGQFEAADIPDPVREKLGAMLGSERPKEPDKERGP